jgi:cyclophilin family peptidyl-prolyl cis-trans isomerase
MNRKEKEKFEIHTGKKKLTPDELKKKEEHERAKKVEKRRQITIILSSVVLVALVIFGISYYNIRKAKVAKEYEGAPPNVTKPTKEEIEEIKNELVVLETTMGNIKIELYPEAAPFTVNNFRRLVKDGFYDGKIFHRVIDDFMIQTGGYKKGQEQEDSVGYTFKDEINPKALGLTDTEIAPLEQQGYKFDYTLPSIKLENGVVAMANAGPNTNGSQFFIITAKDGTPWLNGKHTGFGRVVQGMDVCDKIQKVETYKNPNDPNDPKNDKPLTDVVITKAYIEERK